jgi:hypothetical protein
MPRAKASEVLMSDRFIVEGLVGTRWEEVAVLEDQDRATDVARSLDRKWRYRRVRVVVDSVQDARARRLVTFLGADRGAPPSASGAAAVIAGDDRDVPAPLSEGARDLFLGVRLIAAVAFVTVVGACLVFALEYLRGLP